MIQRIRRGSNFIRILSQMDKNIVADGEVGVMRIKILGFVVSILLLLGLVSHIVGLRGQTGCRPVFSTRSMRFEANSWYLRIAAGSRGSKVMTPDSCS